MKPDNAHHTHRLALLGYLLLGLGCLFGITALIGVFINHTNLQKSRGSYVHSHLLWQIIVFWALLACLTCAFLTWPSATAKVLLTISIAGWLVSIAAGAWYLYHRRTLPVTRHLQQ